MLRAIAAAALLIAVAVWVAGTWPAGKVRTFPAGVTEVHSEIAIDAGHRGARYARARPCCVPRPIFRAARILVVNGRWCPHPRSHRSTATATRSRSAHGLPGYDTPFARFTRNNGVLAEGVARPHGGGRELSQDRGLRRAGQPRSQREHRARADHRERVAQRRGAQQHHRRHSARRGHDATFRVAGCDLRDIRGNGIWTHSLYTSPRNARGVFAENRFERIGRDALQVGHATGVRVERNQGQRIGYPVDDVDMEGRAIPVAVDTAGNVDASVYAGNVFREINGKCFDLDGFHDGAVRGNVCVNRRRPRTLIRSAATAW